VRLAILATAGFLFFFLFLKNNNETAVLAGVSTRPMAVCMAHTYVIIHYWPTIDRSRYDMFVCLTFTVI